MTARGAAPSCSSHDGSFVTTALLSRRLVCRDEPAGRSFGAGGRVARALQHRIVHFPLPPFELAREALANRLEIAAEDEVHPLARIRGEVEQLLERGSRRRSSLA